MHTYYAALPRGPH